MAKEPLKVRKSCYFSNLIIIPCPLDRFTSQTSEKPGLNSTHNLPSTWYSEKTKSGSTWILLLLSDLQQDGIQSSKNKTKKNKPSTKTQNVEKYGEKNSRKQSGALCTGCRGGKKLLCTLSCEKVTIIHICLCLSDSAPSFQARKIFLCKK